MTHGAEPRPWRVRIDPVTLQVGRATVCETSHCKTWPVKGGFGLLVVPCTARPQDGFGDVVSVPPRSYPFLCHAVNRIARRPLSRRTEDSSAWERELNPFPPAPRKYRDPTMDSPKAAHVPLCSVVRVLQQLPVHFVAGGSGAVGSTSRPQKPAPSTGLDFLCLRSSLRQLEALVGHQGPMVEDVHLGLSW